MNANSTSFLQFAEEQRYTTFNTISLVPYIGLEANERWMFGLQGGIYLRHSTDNNIAANPAKIVNKRSTYSVGALARRTFMEGKPLRFFLEPGIRYSWDQRETLNVPLFTPVPLEVKALAIYASPGVTWSVSDHFRLLARLGYLRYVTGKRISESPVSSVKISQFDMSMNPATLAIGAEVRF